MENAQYFEKATPKRPPHAVFREHGSLNGRLTFGKRSMFTKFLHINVLLTDVEWVSREPLLDRAILPEMWELFGEEKDKLTKAIS